MPNAASPGPPPSGDDEARLSGARAEFVGSLPRRLDALRAALRSAEEVPSDPGRANGLLRRVHAVGAAARVLGFASVAEALGEAEKSVKKATASGRPASLDEVARALDLLPSLVLGAPDSMRNSESRERVPLHVWPISVLIYGPPVLAEAISGDDDDTRIEKELTEDPARARELARVVGPDVVIVDADRPGARDLVGELVRDPLVEPVPIVVVGTFDQPEAAGAFVELGAAKVLLKPCSPDTLKRTVHELRDRASKPQKPRDPLGNVTVPVLAERIASEFKRGLVDALEGSPAAQVTLGEGHDVLAAVWGAVARVRELVTLRSGGDLRFQPTGPEGAVPLASYRVEERRAGERGSREARSGDGVSLNGRHIVVADDDPAVVWFMAGLLKAVGVEVIEAHDGKQALELAYTRFPDVVISDVLMPKLDGFSLCHEIKRDVAVRDVPVILLSWKEDLLQRLRELGADADGYLRKEAAASAVVERVREVLNSRARIEERMRAGGEVRGRLDGVTPRLVLELACRAESDLRISLRDAAFLYEVQIRHGVMRSVTRSAPDGSFVRGAPVLSSLLGVSAGRFIVEPDSSPCRAEFTGDLLTVLARPIALARSALAKVAERTLVRLEHLELDRELVEAYLACTPEPAASLTRRLLAGERARDLVLSGDVAPRLLEAVLSDIARRGGVLDAVLAPSMSVPARAAEPPLGNDDVRSAPQSSGLPLESGITAEAPQAPSDALEMDEASALFAAASEPHAESESHAESAQGDYEPEPDSDARPSIPHAAMAVDRDDVGWFSLAVEPTAEPPAVAPTAEPDASSKPPATEGSVPFKTSDPPLRVVGEAPRLPLSDQATPGDWQAGPLFAFGGEHGTLPGVGELPRVGERPLAVIPSEPEPEATAPTTESAAPDAVPVPKLPAEAPASNETPGLELGTTELDSSDDDDDRVTLTIPDPASEPVPPASEPVSLASEPVVSVPEPVSPVPEPLVPDERSAPTQPPSRVARKPVQPANGASPDGQKKGNDSVAGFLVKSVLAAAAAFLATTLLVPVLLPDKERTEPEAAPVVADPPAAAPAPVNPATSPTPGAPASPAGLTLRAETIATPPGVTLDPAQGLVDIELAEASSIKVDDSFVGRFDKRRLLLAPGTHRIHVESERGSATLELEVAAGRAVRVASGDAPASASPAASSNE